MYLAVNYSEAAVELYQERLIEVDFFKIPAWRGVVVEANAIGKTYVHFPFKVGQPTNHVWNTETKTSITWDFVDFFLAETQTPFINIHLEPTKYDYPDIQIANLAADQVDRLITDILSNLRPIIQRYGAEKIILENSHIAINHNVLWAAMLPRLITTVIRETGCGFLFDLSHARIAATYLGMDLQTYIEALPLEMIREIHVTGLQRIEGEWLDVLAQLEPAAQEIVHPLVGRMIDHMPMTASDWSFFDWSIKQINSGQWASPWVVAFEYGGVGALCASVTKRSVLQEQLPSLHQQVKTNSVDQAFVNQGGSGGAHTSPR